MRKLTMRILMGILIFTISMIVSITVIYSIVVYSLNNKVSVIANQMCTTVMKNNYLPKESRDTYVDMLSDILSDYCDSNVTVQKDENGVFITGGLGGSPLSNIVRAITINYSNDLGCGDKLNTVKAYGQGIRIRIQIHIRKITFVNQAKLATGNYSLKDYESGKVESTRPVTLDFCVPCSRYVK